MLGLAVVDKLGLSLEEEKSGGRTDGQGELLLGLALHDKPVTDLGSR